MPSSTINSSFMKSKWFFILFRNSHAHVKATHRSLYLLVRHSSTETNQSLQVAINGIARRRAMSSTSQVPSKFSMSDTLRHNVGWLNNQYERVFGIEEIRAMQNRVLDAESDFVRITQHRKTCQEKIESLKDLIKNIRDKLDITPRQSDNYLKLITEEHKLLREQLSYDTQLVQLKDKEQWALDNLSRLLRQSHEVERIRQERAKYWQIISLGLSVIGGIIALFAQRVRNQNTTIKELNLINQSIQTMEEVNELRFREMKEQINSIRSLMSQIADKLQEGHAEIAISSSREISSKNSASSWTSWLLWVSGYSYVRAKISG